MMAMGLAALLAMQPAPMSGRPLLDDLSRRAVNFFVEQSHPVTGFTKDRAANLTNSDTFDVASVASTGFAMTAYAVGAERGWLDRSTALSRARTTARNLRQVAAKQNGWFYHFINWQTGQRVWQCEVSSIDTSIMLMGLITADSYFQDSTLTRDVSAILAGIDWNWMLTDGGTKPNALTFSHGYRPESGWINNRWDTYSEELMLLVMAYGSYSSLPSGVWGALARPMHQYEGIQLLSGGPLFIHQMSHGFIEFRNKRCPLGYDYWVATRRATLANQRYCIKNPKGFREYGDLFWGLTASDGPDGYQAFGAPIWGDDNGTVAPTTVAASIEYHPRNVLATLANMRAKFPQAWGRYGFSNALNPQRNWVGPDVIGIDLGMMMCAIENERDDFVHRMTSRHRVISLGMQRIGFQSFPPRQGSERDVLKQTP